MSASVIIPVFNGEKTIARTLQALQNKDFPPKEFEVIVVNDGSTDNTERVVSQFNWVKFVSQKNSGPAAARNRGAKEAKGEILVFLDADCVPKKNWLSEMMFPFKTPEIAGVQGRYENPLNHWMARFVQLEIEERYERMEKKEFIDFIGSYSAAYRRDVFLSENGFDEKFRSASGEDPDLSFRLASKGCKMVFAPNAVVAHYHPTSIWKYWKTKFYRAYWRVRMYQKNPEKIRGDSYTNPLLKFQIALFGAATLFGLLKLIVNQLRIFSSLETNSWSALILIFYVMALVLTFPTAFFIMKRDTKIGLIAPFLLFVNIFFFTIGLLAGNTMQLNQRGNPG